MKIIERYFDLADRYRVLVQIDENETLPLKFQDEISDEEVLEEAQRVIAMREEQKRRQLEENGTTNES